MALRNPRKDLHPPSITRTFTTASAQIVLADALEPNNSVSPAGAPMAGVNHLPTLLQIWPVAAGGSLVWLDAFGNSNTIVIPAGAAATPIVPFDLPGTARSIEAGTTAGFQIVATWHPEA